MKTDQDGYPELKGKPLCFYQILPSTNDKARVWAEQGAAEGTIVQADCQTAGHGRMGRTWQSPPGKGLWFSLLLRPQIHPQFAAQATLLVAVALVETLRFVTNVSCQIKWPNDILYEDKKICGILSEMKLTPAGEVDYIIAGVGLNVNMERCDFPEDLADRASSLAILTGRQWDRNLLLQAFRSCMEKWYGLWLADGFECIRDEWLAHNCTLGRQVQVKDDDQVIFCGRAKTLQADGSLVVQDDAGREECFNFGEISIRF